jgi:hypothetical protein
MMGHYYILIKDTAVFVKEGSFFEEQRATSKPHDNTWHLTWERIDAPDLDEARRIAIAIRRWRYPKAHRTIGEDSVCQPRHPQTIWEKAEASASEMRSEWLNESL